MAREHRLSSSQAVVNMQKKKTVSIFDLSKQKPKKAVIADDKTDLSWSVVLDESVVQLRNDGETRVANKLVCPVGQPLHQTNLDVSVGGL